MNRLWQWLLMSVCFSGAVVQGATVSYDFSGTAGTQPAGWTFLTTTPSGTGNSSTAYALNGSGVMTATGTAGNNGEVIQYGAFQVDRQAGSNFSISTTFTTSAITTNSPGAGWNTNIAIRFLASSATSDATAEQAYTLNVARNNNNDHSLTLSRKAVNVAATSPVAVDLDANPTPVLVFNGTSTYTLTLTGTYQVDNSLKLDFSLANGTNTKSGTFTDTSPLTGSYFGLRDRWRNFGTGSISFTANHDSYSVDYVAVPEPASLGLLLAGGLLALRRRRAVC